MDFDSIVLKNKELKTLKTLNKDNLIKNLSTSISSNLYHFGLIQHSAYNQDAVGNEIGNGIFKITDKGKRYLKYKYEKNFKFWFPILLSNFFALTALIISIIALLK